MAIRAPRNSASKASAHRLFVPTMLVLVFVTAAALVLYNGSEPVLHPVGIAKTQVGSSHLHAYVARTIRALKSDEDPAKAKVEALFKQARDHIALANAYASHARRAKLDTVKQLTSFTDQASAVNDVLARPQIRALQEDSTSVDEEAVRMLEKELKDRIKVIRQLMTDSKEFFDNQIKIQKLKDTIFAVNDQLTRAKKQGEFSNLIAARSTPKSLHCLSMRLLEEKISNEEKYAEMDDEVLARRLRDPTLNHYVIFSDNVLGAAVAVNSATSNAKHPQKHVFHVVTDKMNFWAMKVWFKMSPPNNVSYIEVKSMEDYPFIKPSYVPLLQQLESDNQFKFIKYRLMLKHLRFYLPQMFPKLHKILVLEDDVVVQKDLTPLFEMSMEGKVNAAVETCTESYNRYVNFSHPLIKKKFDPNMCTWAYGMNMFDLDAWRKEKCTEEYHYWQTENENQVLWKLGSLPPGLITFYKRTKILDKSWLVLGLGHNPNVGTEKIKKAAVIHYDGNMKPWLDVALNQYRDYWTKYVDYGMVFIQMCNFGH